MKLCLLQVDAFPGDAVIFIRVVNLLRGLFGLISLLDIICECITDENDAFSGLSSTLDVRIVYLDIMKPFAESTLLG